MKRRQFLAGIATTMTLPWWVTGISGCSSGPTYNSFLPPPSDRISPERLKAAVQWIIETPAAQRMEKAEIELQSGLSVAELNKAVFFANIKFRSGSGTHHRTWAGYALSKLSAGVSKQEQVTAALWSLPIFDRTYDNISLDTSYRPAPEPPVAKASAQWRDAIESADPASAEAALLVLFRDGGLAGIQDLLWRSSVRGLNGLMHNPIGTAICARVLEEQGSENAEPILRVLARSHAWRWEKDSPSQSNLKDFADYPRNLESAASMPVGWDKGKPSHSAALELFVALRTASPDEVAREVRSMLLGGVAPGSIWDGLFLNAAESLVQKTDDRAFEVHHTDNLHALCHAFRNTTSSETRALLILQAASFCALFQPNGKGTYLDKIEVADAPASPAEILDSLGAGDPEPLPNENLPRSPYAGQRKAFGQVLAILDRGTPIADVVNHFASHALRKSRWAHGMKYPWAVFEQIKHASTETARLLLASSVFFQSGGSAPDWAGRDQASEIASRVVP